MTVIRAREPDSIRESAADGIPSPSPEKMTSKSGRIPATSAR
ncbi:MAG: hypothetical protein ABSG92_10380 [Conexivisphaerales archaeon]|jgi:hypothetical protein